MTEMQQRALKQADELDALKYRIQEILKDNTEIRLTIDVQQSTIDGIVSEKKHLDLELQETKELLQIYEAKCS